MISSTVERELHYHRVTTGHPSFADCAHIQWVIMHSRNNKGLLVGFAKYRFHVGVIYGDVNDFEAILFIDRRPGQH